MQITEIKVYPVNEDKLKAYVTVTFDNCFVVRDLKVIQGNNRLFVAMPSRRMKDGSFRDVVHPSNSDMRDTLEKAIFEEYEKTLSSPTTSSRKYEGESSSIDA
ncbi:MAG: septation regulator SpoVG [bacterium]